MESHENDLLGEIADKETVLKIQKDYSKVDLGEKNQTLLDFAKKLTLDSRNMQKADVDKLRSQGFSDREILDAAQLIGYFNYSNRVMDSLGIQPEPHMRYVAKE